MLWADISKAPVVRRMRSIRYLDTSELISLNTTLKNVWAIEEPHANIDVRNPEKMKCEEIYANTTRRLDSRRYSVALPFRTYLHILGSSYRIALQCLKSLLQRLNGKPELKQEYAAPRSCEITLTQVICPRQIHRIFHLTTLEMFPSCTYSRRQTDIPTDRSS